MDKPTEVTTDRTGVAPTFGDKLSISKKTELEAILSQYPNTITKKLGRTNSMTYKINVKPGHKVKCRPYQCSPVKTVELRQHIDELLKKQCYPRVNVRVF